MQTNKDTPVQRQFVWDCRRAQLDYESQMATERSEGMREGEANGEKILADLMAKLFSLGRIEDAKKAVTDEKYMEKLFAEFGVKIEIDPNSEMNQISF